MTNEKQLPTFENEAVLEGVVSESSLVVKELNGEKGKYKAITGKIVIQTGENESHVAEYFVKELKKDGGENGIYTNVKTVLDELVTLQDIAQGKAPEGAVASKVRVRGELALNEYYGQDGKLRSFPQVKGVFLNRVKEEHTYEPKATFDVEGVVKSVKDEHRMVDGEQEETGRKKVELLIPTFSGAIPVEFVSRAEDGEYIEENFEIASTVNIYGNMINFSKKIVTKEQKGFGEAKEKVKYENTRELLISGGSVYDEESPKTLEVEQIKELQTKRNVYLAELESKAQQPKKENKPTGFGANPTPTKKKVDPSIAANLF